MISDSYLCFIKIVGGKNNGSDVNMLESYIPFGCFLKPLIFKWNLYANSYFKYHAKH